MPAVSNTSPIVLYDKIDHLWLLRDLYDELHIPAEVFDELNVGRHRHVSGLSALEDGWIIVHRGLTPPQTGRFQGVDRGERAAVYLALTFDEHTDVLIDDRAGRRLARQLGQRVLGSIGVLLVAKTEGRIATVYPLLVQLRQAGLRLDEATFLGALQLANEVPA